MAYLSLAFGFYVLLMHSSEVLEATTSPPTTHTLTVAPTNITPACNMKGCGCEMNTGEGRIDLSPISAKKGHMPFFYDIKGENSSSYFFNPCAPFNLVAAGSPCTVENDVAVCQNFTGQQLFNLGRQDTATYELISGQGVIVTYTGGDEDAVSKVMLVCQENTTESTLVFSNIEDDGNTYRFLLGSPHCCLKKGSSGTSITIGTIIVIAFFSLVVVYLIIGMTYQGVAKGGRGLEIVPNTSFWGSLPGLIKDGILFTFTCGKADLKGNYEKI
eukprot:m.306805 g.306805  ORF g.306805 m.306805 type:complete len:272 (+) comp41598_c0_seq1:39-854(+)